MLSWARDSSLHMKAVEKKLWQINARNIMLKSTPSRLQCCRCNTGLSSFEITLTSPNMWTYSSSTSSKVIDLGANQKRTCNLMLVNNSNFGHICCHFPDDDAFRSKLVCFPQPILFDAPWHRKRVRYQYNVYDTEKYILWATIVSADNAG